MVEPIINETIKNKYDNSPFRIPLRNKEGVIIEYALVDEDDFEKVNKSKWSYAKGYALANIQSKTTKLHHFVFNTPEKGNVIDHIDQDRLNCKKSNLREVSLSTNSQNTSKRQIDTSSIYKGVCWRKKINKWEASCTLNKKKKFIGYYENEKEAAKMYDIYTYKLFGESANNNNLITFEDTVDINFDNINKKKSSKYNIPKNISFIKNSNEYRAYRTYNKKIHVGSNRKTVEEALKDLEEIDKQIGLLKQKEKEEHNQKEITRNHEGQSIIKVKDIEVLVDEELWHELINISWSINKDGYIKNTKTGLMHRYIMKAKEGELVDHINNIKHDNCRSNLRVASSSLNAHNKTKNKNASSKYFGVSVYKKKWRAQIRNNNKNYNIGSFENEIDAANAYNKKAIEIYGINANINIFDAFITDTST